MDPSASRALESLTDDSQTALSAHSRLDWSEDWKDSNLSGGLAPMIPSAQGALSGDLHAEAPVDCPTLDHFQNGRSVAPTQLPSRGPNQNSPWAGQQRHMSPGPSDQNWIDSRGAPAFNNAMGFGGYSAPVPASGTPPAQTWGPPSQNGELFGPSIGQRSGSTSPTGAYGGPTPSWTREGRLPDSSQCSSSHGHPGGTPGWSPKESRISQPHRSNSPDPEVVQYARLLSSQAHTANGFEQKVSALSRRTAAEFRRAEGERGELARRFDALEEFCRQQMGNIDERLGQAQDALTPDLDRMMKRVRTHVDRDLGQLAEATEQIREEARMSREQVTSGLKAIHKRIDGDHDHIQALLVWKKEAESSMEKSLEECKLAMNGLTESRRSTDAMTEHFETQMESALARERKQSHDRLRSSCGELTEHLNRLRSEIVDQQERIEDLGGQISDLGGALATRLQARIASASQTLCDQTNGVHAEMAASFNSIGERMQALESSSDWIDNQSKAWRKELAELQASRESLQELLRRECDQTLEAARDESRTVHLEVMSVDTRVAAMEEHLADHRSGDLFRRRNFANLSNQNKQPGLPASEGTGSGAVNTARSQALTGRSQSPLSQASRPFCPNTFSGNISALAAAHGLAAAGGASDFVGGSKLGDLGQGTSLHPSLDLADNTYGNGLSNRFASRA